MICNVSRLQTFQECRQKDDYLWEQRLIPNRTPTPLLTGGAVHKGLEVYFKTNNPKEALDQLESNYRERIGEMPFILPEEQEIYEKEIRFSKMAFACWARHYLEMGFEVLYPEVTFLVPLPGTKHHCYWMHKLLHPNEINYKVAYDLYNRQIEGCKDSRCRIEHHIKGKCDGVVSRQGKIWLLETKTAAATGVPFYDQWLLDLQPTTYIWGVSKALGIKINGFILNAIKKPNHNFKGSLEEHFAKDPFEQEPYVRTEEDLERFERQAKMMFDDRERAHRDGIIYMSPRRATCVAFNRRCHFFDLCQRHGERLEGEFLQRPLDYVEEDYYRLAGIEPPAKVKTPALYEEASEQ